MSGWVTVATAWGGLRVYFLPHEKEVGIPGKEKRLLLCIGGQPGLPSETRQRRQVSKQERKERGRRRRLSKILSKIAKGAKRRAQNTCLESLALGQKRWLRLLYESIHYDSAESSQSHSWHPRRPVAHNLHFQRLGIRHLRPPWTHIYN